MLQHASWKKKKRETRGFKKYYSRPPSQGTRHHDCNNAVSEMTTPENLRGRNEGGKKNDSDLGRNCGGSEMVCLLKKKKQGGGFGPQTEKARIAEGGM